MAVQKLTHPGIGDRKARAGRPGTDTLPGHAKWRPAADRPDLIGLLEKQNATHVAYICRETACVARL